MHDLLIVGGGFSAVALLLALRAAGSQARIRIVEPRVDLGRGLAYSAGPEPLLNVPAGRMGALRGQEDSFARWWSQRGGSAHGFAPRALYGDYLAEMLRQQAFEHVQDRVVAVQEGGRARLANGATLQSDAIVFCTGHSARSLPPGCWNEVGWVADPWSRPEAVEALPTDQPLLLLGSGLTAVDLWQRLSRRGAMTITMLSRHGWLPQAHRALERPPPAGVLDDNVLGGHASGRSMLREWRALLHAGQQRGLDWRDLLADLRRHTPRLWQQLDARAQRQALRHLQSLWDSHRHRLAPAVAAPLAAAQALGTLQVLAGRLLDAQRDGTAWRLQLQRRGGERMALRVAGVLNCTGPAPQSCEAADHLWRQGRDAGWTRLHANGLGPDCDAQGRLLDAQGQPQPNLWLLGPGLRARDWEATAVPELREHAARLAAQLLAG